MSPKPAIDTCKEIAKAGASRDTVRKVEMILSPEPGPDATGRAGSFAEAGDRGAGKGTARAQAEICLSEI